MNNGYRDLIVWQKSMDLVEEIYKLIKKLPKEETYALSDQIRRAAVSIPSNIAEGQSRASKKEFCQFLSIANGSRAELQTQVLICERVGFFDKETTKKLFDELEEIGRMLNKLMKIME